MLGWKTKVLRGDGVGRLVEAGGRQLLPWERFWLEGARPRCRMTECTLGKASIPVFMSEFGILRFRG